MQHKTRPTIRSTRPLAPPQFLYRRLQQHGQVHDLILPCFQVLGLAKESLRERPTSRQQKGRVEREDGEYGQWLGTDLIRLRNGALDATELERYLRPELPIEVDNPITWWMGRRQQFPTLSTLALDIFSIPAMAADCERALSLAKLTLTSQRLAMDLKTLQMVQCLMNWVRRDAVTLGGVYFKIAVSADEAADL